METGGGDSSEMGLVMKGKKKIDDCYQCQPHPGLQGYREQGQPEQGQPESTYSSRTGIMSLLTAQEFPHANTSITSICLSIYV